MEMNGMKRINQAIGTLLLTCCLLAGCMQNAGKSCEQGIALYEQGQFDQALVKFNQAVTQDETSGAYFTNRGMTYLMLDQYEEAEEDFDRALQLSGDTMQTHRGRGILYMNQGKYEEALEAFNAALALTGTMVGDLDYDILQHKADVQVLMRDYNGAIDTYNILIALEVDAAENYLRRGTLYLRAGRTYIDLFLEDFELAVAYDAHNYENYLTVYRLLENAGYHEEAMSFVEKGLALENLTAEDAYGKGRLLYFSGDYEAAGVQFQEAFAGGVKQAAFYMGKCAESAGDYAAARAHYNELMTDASFQTAECYNQLALCEVMLGNFLDAELYFGQALALDAGKMEPYILWNQVMMYEKQKDYEQAYQVMLEYSKRFPMTEKESKKLAYLRNRS